MNKQEIVQIAKLIQIIVEREVQRNMKPLLSEIKVLNNKVNSLITESSVKKQSAKPSSTKNLINDIIGDISDDYQNENVKPVFNNKKSPLFNIFEDITPFDEDSKNVESILDLKSNSSDPASRILNKLQTTDFRKTLQIMEQSANRHNNSQMFK